MKATSRCGLALVGVVSACAGGDEIRRSAYDWYAQDDEGNVWYLGEDTTEYVNVQPAGHARAWVAGVDGVGNVLVQEGDIRVELIEYAGL